MKVRNAPNHGFWKKVHQLELSSPDPPSPWKDRLFPVEVEAFQQELEELQEAGVRFERKKKRFPGFQEKYREVKPEELVEHVLDKGWKEVLCVLSVELPGVQISSFTDLARVHVNQLLSAEAASPGVQARLQEFQRIGVIQAGGSKGDEEVRLKLATLQAGPELDRPIHYRVGRELYAARSLDQLNFNLRLFHGDRSASFPFPEVEPHLEQLVALAGMREFRDFIRPAGLYTKLKMLGPEKIVDKDDFRRLSTLQIPEGLQPLELLSVISEIMESTSRPGLERLKGVPGSEKFPLPKNLLSAAPETSLADKLKALSRLSASVEQHHAALGQRRSSVEIVSEAGALYERLLSNGIALPSELLIGACALGGEEFAMAMSEDSVFHPRAFQSGVVRAVDSFLDGKKKMSISEKHDFLRVMAGELASGPGFSAADLLRLVKAAWVEGDEPTECLRRVALLRNATQAETHLLEHQLRELAAQASRTENPPGWFRSRVEALAVQALGAPLDGAPGEVAISIVEDAIQVGDTFLPIAN